MNRLIKAEFFKLSKLRGYKVLLFGSVGLGLVEGLSVVIYCVLAGETPPEGYGYTILKLLLAWPMFAAIMTGGYTAVFLCSEYANRTYSSGLLCGLSRPKVFLSKMAVFFAGLLPIFYFHAMIVSAIVSLGYGFGSLTAAMAAEFLKLFFCSVLGYLALGGYYTLLAVWLKNSVAVVGVGFMGAYMQLIWTSNSRGLDIPLLKLSFIYQLNRFWDWDVSLDGTYVFVMLGTFLVTFLPSLLIYTKLDLK